MSGAETARRPVVQCRIGGAQTAAPKWPSLVLQCSSTKLQKLKIAKKERTNQFLQLINRK